MMGEIAGWIAPVATMIAAMMTAANLGARVTGWGFVVFVIGSLAWSTVALTSGQQNLLVTNGFLTLVNLVGIWRWLGRQARYDDGGRAAASESRARRRSPTLFPLGGIGGREVIGADGVPIGHVVDAMARCGDGGISYVVVRSGGVGGLGEALHAIGWGEMRVDPDRIVADVDAAAFVARPALDPSCWPATPEDAGARG